MIYFKERLFLIDSLSLCPQEIICLSLLYTRLRGRERKSDIKRDGLGKCLGKNELHVKIVIGKPN
jgi:hypothetical protein